MNDILTDFKTAYRDAVAKNYSYFAVKIHNAINNTDEVIINSVSNMKNGKMTYYLNAYNDKLQLKHESRIYISDFVYCNNFESIRMAFEY